MKILKLGALFVLTVTLQAVAQTATSTPKNESGARSPQDNCGLLYGKDHSLTFCAPDGWTLDNTILNDQGIYAVFYPDGSSWDEAKESGTFMYINVVSMQKGSTVADMMEADANDAKRAAPAAVIKKGDLIKVHDLAIPILRFAPGGFNRYEAVAYIGEEKVLVMLVVSSKNEVLFKKDYPAFVQLVQSYKFLTSNVTIEHK